MCADVTNPPISCISLHVMVGIDLLLKVVLFGSETGSRNGLRHLGPQMDRNWVPKKGAQRDRKRKPKEYLEKDVALGLQATRHSNLEVGTRDSRLETRDSGLETRTRTRWSSSKAG